MVETSIDIANYVELDRLQGRYVAALNRNDMTAWLKLFSAKPEASYVCTTREHVDEGLPLALMLDDNRYRIEDRVMYITKIWTGTFQNYRTRHIVQRISAEQDERGHYRVLSNFIVMFTNDQVGTASVLTVGEYVDVVERDDAGEFKFLSKTAILDTSVLPHYSVYPI